MKKTSRKAIRPKKARARTDHPAGCRVSDGELSTVRSDIDLIGQASGIKPSLGSYTKHALLSYPRYRRLEVQLRKLVTDDAIGVVNFDELTRAVLVAEHGDDELFGLHKDAIGRVREALGKETIALLDPARKFYAELKTILEAL